jgi:hypothetical protein
MNDYADPMNEIPKVVFSKTLERASWAETSIARGELAARAGRSSPPGAPASRSPFRARV